ncbi:hypothetical protein DFH08DRAFT_1043669 [Mycena albidolilacea]|uniref:Uncharacterized protein n=1 Tax=Mycena albidolilacea TaxID=1033008 RepID=A0AAD7AH81_9AGAR|nr:hypothetical protein DFH08DRAFT_1043669 [Mycena albidolilacea]
MEPLPARLSIILGSHVGVRPPPLLTPANARTHLRAPAPWCTHPAPDVHTPRSTAPRLTPKDGAHTTTDQQAAGHETAERQRRGANDAIVWICKDIQCCLRGSTEAEAEARAGEHEDGVIRDGMDKETDPHVSPARTRTPPSALSPRSTPMPSHPSCARQPAVRTARLPGDATLHLVSDDRLPPHRIVKERRRSVAHPRLYTLHSKWPRPRSRRPNAHKSASGAAYRPVSSSSLLARVRKSTSSLCNSALLLASAF